MLSREMLTRIKHVRDFLRLDGGSRVLPDEMTTAAAIPAKQARLGAIATRVAVATKSAKQSVKQIDKQRRDALNARNVVDLKALLKRNEQITTGDKAKLVKRVIDCVKNGNLPRCPECGLGRMKLRSYGFSCPGGYDDDEYLFCGNTIDLGGIERPPWQFETPGGLF